MIDIHCHLLYGVDDGAETPEESVAMLKEAKKQGITAIILTPHYRHGMFPYNGEKILNHYERIRPVAQELGIQLSLGTEYHVNSSIVDYLRKGRCLTLAGTRYVLTEYAYATEYAYIEKMTQELILQGFTPVIAHVERYDCMRRNPDCVRKIRNAGALIQINCDGVLGLQGWKEKRYCNKLLREGYVDYIASDSHRMEGRVCNMLKCYEYVSKKYGQDLAQKLMRDNQSKILNGEKMQF